MRERHEIPTHLGVEDKLMFGLTVRQLLWIGGGIALGYTVWQHLGPLPRGRAQMLTHASLTSPVPAPVRLLLAALPLIVAVILALYRHRRRTAEEWLFAYLHFCVTPKRMVWRLPRPRCIRDLATLDAELLAMAGDVAGHGVDEGAPAGVSGRPSSLPSGLVALADGLASAGRLSPVAPPASPALAALQALLAGIQGDRSRFPDPKRTRHMPSPAPPLPQRVASAHAASPPPPEEVVNHEDQGVPLMRALRERAADAYPVVPPPRAVPVPTIPTSLPLVVSTAYEVFHASPPTR